MVITNPVYKVSRLYNTCTAIAIFIALAAIFLHLFRQQRCNESSEASTHMQLVPCRATDGDAAVALVDAEFLLEARRARAAGVGAKRVEALRRRRPGLHAAIPW
jgi:hypothetical protein